MTEDLTLTSTQFDALDATLAGQGPYARRSKASYDKGGFRHVRSMGGARRRMVVELEERGLINGSWAKATLTAKGYRALDAALAKKKFDPTDGRRAQIAKELPLAEKVEAEAASAASAKEEADRARYERERVAKRKARLAEVREVLADSGFDPSGLTDDAVLGLANAIAEASHSDRFYRYLDDADLSFELDEAEKQSHRPGTLGADMRSKKVQAIRAEFVRRAEVR